jgi:2-haloacid dehalogenase
MLDFSRFRVLTFDCYGTLIDWESGIFSALRPILSAHGKNVPDAVLLAMYGEFEAEAETGAYRPYREVLKNVVREYGQELGFSPSEAEVRSLPESVASWQPFPDTVEALRLLKERYRLAILSNIDDDLFATTAPKLGVDFDYVISAQQARAYKPSLEVFRLAQKQIGMKSEEWLHVAQSVYHDIVPAKAMGLATVWVNRPSARAGIGAVKVAEAKQNKVHPDLTVPSLEVLVEGITASDPRLNAET